MEMAIYILAVITIFLFAVRIAKDAVGTLYKFAPALIILAWIALTLHSAGQPLFEEESGGVIHAENFESTEDKSGRGECTDEWCYVEILPSPASGRESK